MNIHPKLLDILTEDILCPNCSCAFIRPEHPRGFTELSCFECQIYVAIIDGAADMLVYRKYYVYLDFKSQTTDIYYNNVDMDPSISVNRLPSCFKTKSVVNFVNLVSTFQ